MSQSVPLGVGNGLWFVIVDLPGLSFEIRFTNLRTYTCIYQQAYLAFFWLLACCRLSNVTKRAYNVLDDKHPDQNVLSVAST